MKQAFPYRLFPLLLLLLLAGASVRAQPGGWTVDPAPYQYSMTMVAQIRVNNVPNHLLNNHLAAFSRGQIRAYATPVKLNGQAYYFLNFYSDVYKGDTLYFRVYRGLDRKIYESVDTVVFRHHLALGKFATPVQIRLHLGDKPLIYSLPEVNYTENTCEDVLDVQTSDQPNTEGNGLTYSIIGGDDATRFSIHPQTGLLKWFNFIPDADMPGDANGDNRYEVEVKVTDASNTVDIQKITINVIKSIPLQPLVCPANQTFVTSDNGTGDCNAEAIQTAVPMPNLCAVYDLGYQLSGATTGSGAGAVPLDQLFLKGTTTVTYTRAGGSPCTFTVTVADDEKPGIACPANLSLECSAAPAYYPPLINAWIATAGVTDNCGATITTSYGVGSPPLSCNLTLGLTVVFTATDATGNTAKCTRTVLADDTQKPLFTAVPANVTVQCSAVPAVGTAVASDQCDQSVSLQYNGQTRTNGACPDSYTLTRKWTATDDCGNSQTATQLITVQDTQMPNFTSVPANITVQCNAVPGVGSPTATDNCDANVTVNFDSETRTDGSCADTYILTRKWTASDNCGNTRTATQRITVQDTQKPVFTSVPANVTVQCNAVPPAGNPTANDNCDASVTIAYLGQTIKSGTCADSYTITRTWRATDNCSNTQTVSQLITVRDTEKPVFTSAPQNITIQCSDPLPAVGTVTATDNCDLSVSITYLGQSSTYVNCPASYQLTRSWKATDNCGNTTLTAQVITVQDTQAPNFTSVPGNTTLQCSALVPPVGNPTATDNCSGYVQITFLGQTSVAGSCPANYTITRTWRAQDECGNSKTASQVITIQDTQAPDFSNAPANMALSCGTDLPAAPVVTATDNCDNFVPVTYLGETNNGPDCPFTVTRTWTVSDDCGNAKTHTQVIAVGSQFLDGGGKFKVQSLKFVPKARDRSLGFDPESSGQISNFELYPNPAKEEVWLAFELDSLRETAVLLFDARGRMVQRQVFDAGIGPNRFRMDLREQAAGLYLVQVRMDGLLTKNRKLIVLKN